MRSIESSFLAVVLVVLAACGRPAGPAVERKGDPALAGQAEEVHWGYAGEIGPEQWADLSPDFALCRSGSRQSPIDLTGATPIEGVTLQRQPGSTVLTIEQRAHVMDLIDNGHTIQITNDAPVHFEAGEHDPIWDPIINALPSGTGAKRHLEGLNLDPTELHPLAERYFRYEGSLTTPPCSEGVHWVVMAERHHLSQEQLAALTSHLHDNNRPVQPLGERRIDSVTR